MDKQKFNKNLFLLLSGQCVSQLGDKFYEIALAVWILQTTNSAAAMGVFMFFALLPQVVLGLVAGGFIDRWNRKNILIVTDIVRMVIVGMVIAAFFQNSLSVTVIIVAQVLLAINSAFFTPTVSAIIPQIVDKDNLVGANSKSQLITGMVTVIGPVLGGMAVPYLGYGVIFIVNAVSFFASAILESFLHLPTIEGKTLQKSNILKNLEEGYAYIFKRRKIVIVLAIVAIVHLFVGANQVVIPVFAGKLLGVEAQTLGYLQAAFGIGSVVMSMVLGMMKSKIKVEKTLFGGIFSIAVVYLIIAVVFGLGVHVVVPYLVIFPLLGCSIILTGISFQVILQKSIDPEMGGRVFSIVNSARYLSIPIASLVFGTLLNNYKFYYILGIAGLITLLVTFILLKVFNSRTSQHSAETVSN